MQQHRKRHRVQAPNHIPRSGSVGNQGLHRALTATEHRKRLDALLARAELTKRVAAHPPRAADATNGFAANDTGPKNGGNGHATNGQGIHPNGLLPVPAEAAANLILVRESLPRVDVSPIIAEAPDPVPTPAPRPSPPDPRSWEAFIGNLRSKYGDPPMAPE